MQAIAERARQALGVGHGSGFVASSLEAQHKTLEELAVYADPLRHMVSSAEHFKDDTTEFLDGSCRFMRDTPFPRLWTQTSPLEVAEAMHTQVPADHAAWFDVETHNSLAEQLSPAVGFALQRELVGPMKQWLLAYEVLKGLLSRLESKRLAYDAERRRLAAAVAKASDAAAAGVVQSASINQPSAAGTIAAAVEVAQMQEEAAAASPSLSEYESDVEALDDGLAWLVSGALRLKALIADTAGGVAAAARGWQVPQGLLPELEPSTFGKGYEVTMTVTDAPMGAEALLGTEAPPQATTATPDLVAVKTDEDAGSSASDEAAGGQTVAGSMLPSDEMVYGGGVAPPPAAHSPSGGGVAQLIKDALVGATDDTTTTTAAAAAGGGGGGDEQQGDAAAAGSSISNTAAARDAAGLPMNPDLSSELPADDALVYGGGVAPSPLASASVAPGGGVTDLIRDTVVGRGSESADEAYHDAHSDEGGAAVAADGSGAGGGVGEASAGGGGGGGIINRLKGTVARLVGASEGEQNTTAAAGGAGGGAGGGATSAGATGDDDGGDVDPIDPQELMTDRPSRSYSGSGVGQVEARLSDVAVAGLGAAGRHLRRARSEEGQMPAAAAARVHTGLAASPEMEIPDADKKQLSTIVLPASPTAAAAAVGSSGGGEQTAGISFVDNVGTQSVPQASDTADTSATSAAHDDSNAAGSGGAVGGLFAAISRTLQEGRARLTGNNQQQQQQQEEGGVGEGETAAELAGGADSGWRVDVQGAEYSGAPGAPGTPASVASAREPEVNPAAVAAPHTGSGKGMHVGPVAPYPGHIVAPGTAEFVKGPEPPGGAAAAGEQSAFDSSKPGTSGVGSGMHIGPISPSPGAEPAPGTAHYQKGSTPPGGAAAAGSPGSLPVAANISSNEAAYSSGMHIGPVAPHPNSEPAPGTAHYIKGPTPPGGAAAADAPAGSNEEGTTAAGADAPYLSKLLPKEERPLFGGAAKPAGGGVGTFIRDTLLGPPKNQ